MIRALTFASIILVLGCARNDAPVLDPERAEFCRNYERTLPSRDDTPESAHAMTRNNIRVSLFCDA